MKFDIKFRRRRPSDKWTDLLVIAIIIAIGAVLAAREGIGAAAPLWIVGAAYAVVVVWQIHQAAPKEPEPTPPTDDDLDSDEAFTREMAGIRRDGVDVEVLWKNAHHRREYPNCRYCKFLDEEKAAAADKAVIDDAEPGTRGAL